MDAGLVTDLIELLKNPQPNIRQQAAEYVCGLTSSEEGRTLFSSQSGHIALSKLLGDNIAISKYAITSLINMCGDASVLTDLTNDELVDKLMENIRDESYPLINLNLMLLANVSTNDMGAGAVLQLRQYQGKVKGLHLCRLVHWFCKTPVDHKESDPYQYVASILNNISRLYEGRDLLMNDNRKLIEKLIPYISSGNPIRRKGVMNMIRNVLLDDFYWDQLVDNWNSDGKLKEIVNRVCSLLNGNHIIEKKPIDSMITSLQKEREKDTEIIKICLDLILVITKYQKGRELLREANVYYVIRDMHMELEATLPEDVVDIIGDLVTHLMADEENPSKHEGPTVEEITEEKELSDNDDMSDLPDLI